VIEGDICRQEDCQKIIAQTIQAFGRIDAVINNAAWIGPIGFVAEVQPEDWTRALEVNLFGLFRMCHEAVPFLRRTNGKVVNISSGRLFGHRQEPIVHRRRR
jgi:NAD(P)-dependent dehydrogenase (short-subunit alcohol dehydrogenase family)